VSKQAAQRDVAACRQGLRQPGDFHEEMVGGRLRLEQQIGLRPEVDDIEKFRADRVESGIRVLAGQDGFGPDADHDVRVGRKAACSRDLPVRRVDRDRAAIGCGDPSGDPGRLPDEFHDVQRPGA